MIGRFFLVILFFVLPQFTFSKAVVPQNTAAFFNLSHNAKPQHHLKLKPAKKTKSFKPNFKEDKKWLALIITVLAGMLGGHRLYLGTKPWIPALYLFTFGGGFLLLPIIDFFVLLFAKDIQPYLENPNFFMWIR
ncbi:MAG: TM2 domain-containing protein [Bacteroidota bacterium]